MSSLSSSNQPPAPGRIVAPRYLSATTASSRNHVNAKSAKSAQATKSTTITKSSISTLKKSQNASSVGIARKPIATKSTLGTIQPSVAADLPRKVSKPANASIASSSTSTSAPKPHALTVVKKQELPSDASDPLQVAAQLYAWSYMTCELETSVHVAQSKVTNALKTRQKELEAAESDIADQSLRFEMEQKLAFLDEITSDPFAQELASLIQQFLQHGETCGRVTTEALRIGAHGGTDYARSNHESPVLLYNGLGNQLHSLQVDGTKIEQSLVRLLEPESLKADSLLRPPLSACLSLLRARIVNITSAEDLIICCKNNLGINLQLESLRLHS